MLTFVFLLLTFGMRFSSFDIPATHGEIATVTVGQTPGAVPLVSVPAPPGTAGNPPAVYYPDFTSPDFSNRLEEGQCHNWEGLWPGVPRPARCDPFRP